MTTCVDHRDLGAFIPAFLDDYGLDPIEFRLYSHIARRAGSGNCFEGAKRMAEICRVNVKTIPGKLRSLEAYGLIRIDRTLGRTNDIILTPSRDWVTPRPLTSPVSGSGSDHTQKRITPTPKNGSPPTPKNGSGGDPKTDHKGTPYKGILSKDRNPPIVPQGGRDTGAGTMAPDETARSASLANLPSLPADRAPSLTLARLPRRRDAIAKTFELGRTALDVREAHTRYRAMCNRCGAAPGALRKAQQAAASTWEGGVVPEGFQEGLTAFIWVKAAEAAAGHPCLAIPSFANYIENPHYGEDAIARQALLLEYPDLANPRTAKKSFERRQVDDAMSAWASTPDDDDEGDRPKYRAMTDEEEAAAAAARRIQTWRPTDA